MAPEYGATCGFFPIDERTHRLSRADRPRRRPDRAGPGLCPGAGPVARRRDARAAVHRHARARHGHDRAVARRAQAAAGPGAAERRRRPVQRRARAHLQEAQRRRASPVEGESFDFGNGDVAIAAITSCTNTSNPSVLVAAGLVARKARAQGPDEQAVGQDQPRAGQPGGHRLSQRERPQRGPRTRSASTSSATAARPASAIRARCAEPISKAINDNDLVAVSVLSGNRNFEGRVSPDCRANYLASPPLVVAYALKGTVRSDMVNEPIGTAPQRRAGVPQGHLADQRGSPRADRRPRPFGDVPPAAMPTSITATSAGARSRSPAARPTAGRRNRPTSRTRPTSPA